MSSPTAGGDASRAKEYREKLVEAAAETDDELTAQYLEQGSLDEAEMLKARRLGINTIERGAIVGSASGRPSSSSPTSA